MNDLTAFLLARIAEDEAIAREAAKWYGRRLWSTRDDERGDTWVFEKGEDPLAVTLAKPGAPFGAFVVQFQAGRVLAECEAKRQIIELHPHVYRAGDGNLVGDEWACQRCINEWYWCPTLRALAAPYADHPDYRDEWRPS